MKRVLIASILGLAASAATSFGQANFIFDTYSPSSGVPMGQVTWTTDASLAPAGKAGLSVLDSESFTADLLWAVGTVTGDLGLAVPTSTIPVSSGPPYGGTTGWIQGGGVTFMNAYAGQNVVFTIEAWKGASYATATARGSETWTEAGITPAGPPSFFAALPDQAIYVANVIPEPTTLALVGLGAAALLIVRRRS